jgi:hypothetical protein
MYMYCQNDGIDTRGSHETRLTILVILTKERFSVCWYVTYIPVPITRHAYPACIPSAVTDIGTNADHYTAFCITTYILLSTHDLIDSANIVEIMPELICVNW